MKQTKVCLHVLSINYIIDGYCTVKQATLNDEQVEHEVKS